ncbi:MAG TPA: AI-2E family transporter, partial [Synergistaceae bacterium]|nr:AI-2E family transporter [Synergistaceae bacterium]
DKKCRTPETEYAHLEKSAFLLMLLLVSVLFVFLLKPFWGALFWACIIGLIFSPLHRRLLKKMDTPKPNVAALATLTTCSVICIAPALFIIGTFFQEGLSLYQSLESGEFDLGARMQQLETLFPAIKPFFEYLHMDMGNLQAQLSDAALGAAGYLAQNAVELGQKTMQLFISLALMLYVAFFMLRDGEKLVDLLARALPLNREREHLIFDKFAETVRATVKGNLLVAVVQGTLGGFIFWALGIREALLWGVVMTLFSLIPVIGAGLIWIPVSLYLLALGAWIQGIVLILFGAVVIGLADNVLRPLLVGHDTKLPDYVVLLSTLGGFALFGMNGFVLGPLVAALFMAFWGIFMREYNNPKPLPSKEESF